MATFDFTDAGGYPVSVRSEQIVHVARPKGGFKGELTLSTGAKWGFGGPSPMTEYKRAKAAFELAHEDKKKEKQQ